MQQILVVEANPTLRRSLARRLGADFQVSAAASGAEALQALDFPRLDAAFIDLELPDRDGFDLFRDVARVHPRVAIIATSARAAWEAGPAALQAGAVDYLVKPAQFSQASEVARRAIRTVGLAEQAEGPSRNRRTDGSHLVVARSAAMSAILKLVDRVAPSNAAVLLSGESGTGKEVIARRLHRLSPRRDRAFVAINCAGLPGPLLESEMFGHERGSFTGAEETRRGLFEAADGGTLFLDELGDLPSGLQPKLLRALEDGSFLRVGGRRTLRSDVRLVCATNRDLRDLLAAGRFRADLYWRINTVEIELPPLRGRPEDIAELAGHFVRAFGETGYEAPLCPAVATALGAYDWPGNVRELRNVVERAVILAGPEPVRLEHLPEHIAARSANLESGQGGACSGRLAQAVAACERQTITEALNECKGNRGRAASALGISLRTLHYKLRRLELS